MDVAEHHRDDVADRIGVGPERVAGQPVHVEHRPEIEPAAQDRIARVERLHQPLRRHRQHRRQVAFGHAQRGQIGAGALGRMQRPRGGHLLSAHRRGAVEQAACGGHPHQRRDLRAATRLAEDHHPPRIAPEGGNIVAHPLQCQDQVELPDIAAIGKARVEPREIEIAQRVEAVVDGHDHHIAARRQRLPIVERIGDAAVRIGPAVDVEHHRLARAGIGLRRPDIEVQAVFVLRTIGAALRTDRTEGVRRNGLAGRCEGDRGAKPWRGAVADAAKGAHAAVARADEIAYARANRARRRGPGRRAREQSGAPADRRAPRPALSAGHRARRRDRRRDRLGGTARRHRAANV